MNTLSRKVLQEVLTSLLIMEPNGRRSGSEEEVDVTEQRGFWDGTNFCLGAITQLTKKKEREKERQVEKHQHNQYIKI